MSKIKKGQTKTRTHPLRRIKKGISQNIHINIGFSTVSGMSNDSDELRNVLRGILFSMGRVEELDSTLEYLNSEVPPRPNCL